MDIMNKNGEILSKKQIGKILFRIIILMNIVVIAFLLLLGVFSPVDNTRKIELIVFGFLGFNLIMFLAPATIISIWVIVEKKLKGD